MRSYGLISGRFRFGFWYFSSSIALSENSSVSLAGTASFRSFSGIAGHIVFNRTPRFDPELQPVYLGEESGLLDSSSRERTHSVDPSVYSKQKIRCIDQCSE